MSFIRFLVKPPFSTHCPASFTVLEPVLFQFSCHKPQPPSVSVCASCLVFYFVGSVLTHAVVKWFHQTVLLTSLETMAVMGKAGSTTEIRNWKELKPLPSVPLWYWVPGTLLFGEKAERSFWSKIRKVRWHFHFLVFKNLIDNKIQARFF